MVRLYAATRSVPLACYTAVSMPRAAHRPLLRVSALLLSALALGCAQDPADLTNWPPREGPVVVLGDSLVAGTGAGVGEDFPSVMARELGVEVLNAGVPGDRSSEVADRAERVAASEPSIVVVAAGGNDLLAQIDPERTEANLEEAVRALQAGGAVVVLVGYRFGPGHWDQRGMVRGLARDTGSWFLEDPLEGLFDDRRYKSDRIHLNAAGYEILGERIADGIRPLLEEAY